MVCCFPGGHVGHIEAEDEGQGNEIQEGVEVFHHIFEKPKRKRKIHAKTGSIPLFKEKVTRDFRPPDLYNADRFPDT
jgi:hypothetical protein